MQRPFKDADAPEVHRPQQPGLEAYNNSSQRYPEMEQKNLPFYRADPPPTPKPERRVCGLRVATFCLLLALILVVVLAAAIGGGVGSTISQQKNQKLAAAQSTIARLQQSIKAAPSPTETGSNGIATVTVTATPTPTSDCTAHANQNFVSSWVDSSGVTYKRICGSNVDLSVGTIRNIFEGVTLTFDDCIEMCDTYNYWTETRNLTVINYKFEGEGVGSVQGSCFCTQGIDYKIINQKGFDSAYLVGSFDASDLP